MNTLTINNFEIRMNEKGLFSLNDLRSFGDYTDSGTRIGR